MHSTVQSNTELALSIDRSTSSAAACSKPSDASRIAALDFTKGALVIIMVLYHWINYFISPAWPYYRYLRFLTPSFILVSGFLISNIYLVKYKPSNRKLWIRLAVRGIKLLAVFLALNAGKALVIRGMRNYTTDGLGLGMFAAAFGSGNIFVAGGKLVAFYILVPISYLLLISAVLMPAYSSFRRTFHLTCGALLVAILILHLSGRSWPNLEFVTIGMLGLLAGFVPIDEINRAIRHPRVLIVAYAGYVTAITVWNVPFPLLVIGAYLSVGLIYLLGLQSREGTAVTRLIVLLGKYSLLGYVAQIAILQGLSVGFRHVNPRYPIPVMSFVAALMCTILTVELVNRSRMRSRIADRLYKLVFA